MSLHAVCIVGVHIESTNERTNERNNHKRNDLNKTMSQDNTVITSDANVVSILSVESPDMPSVADIPRVAVPKPKKTKRASQRGITKRGLLGDDDNLTSTKPPIDNDDSDVLVEPTDVTPHVSETVVTATPLDEVVDYDEPSVQSTQDNEVLPTTSTAEPSQPHSEEADFLQPTESLKRRKIDLGQLMVKTNVTKRAGSGRPLSQFKAPKRPEITRLPDFDDSNGSPTNTAKVAGKGSGKDGRPIVADLVRLRESESRLAQELANEKARAQAQLHGK